MKSVDRMPFTVLSSPLTENPKDSYAETALGEEFTALSVKNVEN